MAVMKELLAQLEEAARTAYDEAFEEGRKRGIQEAVDALLALFGRTEDDRCEEEPIVEERASEQTGDSQTMVCNRCGRELPVTYEFFRIYKRHGGETPMQPCRECFKKSKQQPLTLSPKRPKGKATLAERFPTCPREDCHMRKDCGLVDKPTECESFMKLHRGEE